MKEISLNILDIAQNSVKAGADRIEITVDEQPAKNLMSVIIADNGCGMDEQFLARVTDPFTTTRTTRKVGMGIPLFKQAAEQTGGSFEITSQKGKGTVVKADFVYDSIDRMPLGDLASTLAMLTGSGKGINWVFIRRYGVREYEFSCEETVRQAGELDFAAPEIQEWLTEYFEEQEKILYGG